MAHTDGSQEQAYVERSIRELIDSSKQSVIDMRSAPHTAIVIILSPMICYAML